MKIGIRCCFSAFPTYIRNKDIDWENLMKKRPDHPQPSVPHNADRVLAWNECPAKSCPLKSVRRHSLECGAVYEALRSELNFPESLLAPGTLLFALGHDCGKISPDFIWKINPELAKESQIGSPIASCRHESISEAAFRQFFGRRSDRAEVVVGWHHGKHNPNADTNDSWDYGGPAWGQERENFLQWAAGYVKNIPSGMTNPQLLLSAGMLCVADWIASDENNFIEDLTDRPFEDLEKAAVEVLHRNGFVKPDFIQGLMFEDIFPFHPNPAQAALAVQADGPGIYLLEDAMGSGKTAAALYAAYRLIAKGVNRGLFFALPTRLTSDKIYENVESFLGKVSPGQKARLIHGTAWLNPSGGEMASGESWFAPSKRALLAPFGVGTVDQLLKGVLNVKHFFVRLAGLAGKVIVIDEVHFYDSYMNYLLINACRILVQLNCSVILLSATLPERRRAELMNLTGQVEKPCYPRLTVCRDAAVSETCLPSVMHKQIKTARIEPDNVLEKILNAAANGCNCALIVNTVGEAQKWFRALRAKMTVGRFPSGLLHSRYPLWRRHQIEGFWLDSLGKDHPEKRPHGSVLVSTQILEQSVDVDFDLMVSDIAPCDLLFQRLGRLWRHSRGNRPAEEAEFCWIDRKLREAGSIDGVKSASGASGRIYPLFLLYRTEKIWSGIPGLELPGDMQNILEADYRPPESASGLEAELYDIMQSDVKNKINAAMANAQLSLFSQQAAAGSDDEDAPTRLIDVRQQGLLLLRKCKLCGKELSLELSDGRVLEFRSSEPFQIEKMRILAENLVSVPTWQLADSDCGLPEPLAAYWKFDPPAAALIRPDGSLTLPDGGGVLSLRYSDEEGIAYEPDQTRKENDETLSADW